MTDRTQTRADESVKQIIDRLMPSGLKMNSRQRASYEETVKELCKMHKVDPDQHLDYLREKTVLEEDSADIYSLITP